MNGEHHAKELTVPWVALRHRGPMNTLGQEGEKERSLNGFHSFHGCAGYPVLALGRLSASPLEVGISGCRVTTVVLN
jgi:hypothetical protein